MEARRSPYLKHLYVCVNRREGGRSCCAARGGERIRELLKEYVNQHGLKGRVRVSSSGCMDLCEKGANVMVYPDHRWYRSVTVDDVQTIIRTELEPLIPRSVSGTVYPVPDSGASRPRSEDSGTKAFFLDLGNVLVLFDHMASAQKIAARTGVAPQDLFRLFFESPLVTDHDAGRISTRRFFEELKRQIGLKADYEEFLDAWNDIFTENREMSALVRQLLDKYPCYLISNTNRPHFEFIRGKFDILDQLHGWVLSYEVGCLKPDPAIYRRGLELCGYRAEEVFYVDDRQDLIQAAEALGFQTHRFTATDTLIEDLRARGILNGGSGPAESPSAGKL